MNVKIWTCCKKNRFDYLKNLNEEIHLVFFSKPDIIVVNESIFFEKKMKRKFIKKIMRCDDAIRVYVSKSNIIPDLNIFDYAIYDGDVSFFSNRVMLCHSKDLFMDGLLKIFQKKEILSPRCTITKKYLEMHYYDSLSTIGKKIYWLKNKISNKLRRMFL